MIRTTNTIAAVLLTAITAAQWAYGQQPGYGQLPPAAAPAANPLPLIPQLPEVPNSLMQPGAASIYACNHPECPYFQRDGILDPDELGRPGWLADIDIDLTTIHVKDELASTVNGNTVSVPMAPLKWTVGPRLEVGYRLPSGFGEFDVSYRFLYANGTGSWTGGAAAPDGAASLTSLFHLNSGDFDYASNESSLLPDWNMKWRFGLRLADVVFGSTADESLVEAAGGSDIFERSIRDHFSGAGPHAGLELKHPFGDSGLSLAGRIDGAIIFGQNRQVFSTVSTNAALSGATVYSNPEQLPVLSGFLGLDWHPPQNVNLHFLAGYQAEYWWNVGRISTPDIYNGGSGGEFSAQGAQLRLELNY